MGLDLDGGEDALAIPVYSGALERFAGAFTRVSAGGENTQDLVNANEDHG